MFKTYLNNTKNLESNKNEGDDKDDESRNRGRKEKGENGITKEG